MKDNENNRLPNLGATFDELRGEIGSATEEADDFSRYLGHIAHLDMPIDCKIELLRVVQEIMRSFVDRAFGEDAVQLARKGGDGIRNVGASDSAPMIPSGDHQKTGDKALMGAFETRAGRATRKDACQP